MAKGNRDKSPRQSTAKRARQKLKDEGMRIVIDVPLHLVQVQAFPSCLASTEMDSQYAGAKQSRQQWL